MKLVLGQPGLWHRPALRAQIEAAGWQLARALDPEAAVAVWGHRPWSTPGRRVASWLGRPVVTLEDGFLSAIRPGSNGPPPVSITIDERGAAIDASRPSRLEDIIQEARGLPLRPRAAAGIDRLRALGLSKWSPSPRGVGPLPEPGYVLVVDQVRGDASIAVGAAGPETFEAMLATARQAHPGARIVVKAHPAARRGHLTRADLGPGETWLDAPVNPWDIVERAAAVYAVTSQLGYEALLAGRPVHLFGLPFYAGWGLTHDRLTCPRRTARPQLADLFAATHLLYPHYWDPETGAPTSFEGAVGILAARARQEQNDPRATRAVYAGVARWKRRGIRAFGPGYPQAPLYRPSAAAAVRTAASVGAPRVWAWASREETESLAAARAEAAAAGIAFGLVEDGFLRSAGLGARLLTPASLVFDERGIHYDPSSPSDLERLIAEAAAWPADDPRLQRARALRHRIAAAGVTKYNLRHAAGQRSRPHRAGRDPPAWTGECAPGRPVVLVAGQVADDASVRRGTVGCAIRDTGTLLAAARAAQPEAFIVFKPHPDVEAGLRRGRIDPAVLRAHADAVATDTPAETLLRTADRVWTLTSGIGFEALLRGVAVTCAGVPFYAGWGLTHDLGAVPARRSARPSLDALVWAALIAYPRYVDPVTGHTTSPERLVDWLATAPPQRPQGAWRRVLSGLQDGVARAGLVQWR
ncbi:MAG: capsular polysaccharide biosynthesis protein [Pseudomonadota bacterium]